ncbi:hypothetical protein SNE40_018138 [Patella caerulea]|uniref:DDE Tnp4 domain-containing protein n=1 Tax=Patella caerulea TaxID=87958 RepID=A0AAN8J9W6_PATCE
MGELFGHERILIGDSAYPLRRWLVSVMKDNGRLTLPHRQFNRCLLLMRQLVERVIGHVKGRFRRLRCVHVYIVETAIKIVIAACVLHNVCIANQEELEYLEFNDEQGHIQNFGIPNNNDGIAIRDRLVRVFET